MFSQNLMEWINEGYSNAMQYLANCGGNDRVAQVEAAMNGCTEDEQVVMKYYYGAMPYSDLSDTAFELLKKYAQHAVFLRKNIPWCKDIPEKTFLTDVAAYRINNEKIMDCRSLFFSELWNRVKDMSMEEAVIEANYWCAEHGSYHLADSRTASALTVYRSGYGRCGEESVFTATVLRSIGIPARQIYAPLWSHCDDNHAWVEAWCNGEWYFLGACEPDEILNNGWFTGPASRGLIQHAKYFSCLPVKEDGFRQGFVHYLNRVSMYAHTIMFTLEVVDGAGKPMEGVTVHFELLNATLFGNIATKVTDENGCVTLELGKGDIRIHLIKDEMWMQQTVSTKDGQVRLVFDHAQNVSGEWDEYQLHAPDFAVLHPGIKTEEQQVRNRKRSGAADRMRLERIASWYDAERAKAFPQLESRLKESAANFDMLMTFLERDDNPYRVKLIEALTIKDMYDLEADVLEEHLQAAMAFEGKYPEDIFVRFVLNPRVANEELSCYREFINTYFTKEQKQAFAANPKSIWTYIHEHVKYDESRHYEHLRVSPKGALELGLADPVSQRVLFVAICRTLGIPAKLNMMHHDPEYWCDGTFVLASEYEQVMDAELSFSFAPNTEWKYFVDWSLCELENGNFRPLGLFRCEVVDGKMNVSVAAGVYRAVVTVRLPNGDQLVREMLFTVKSGEKKSIEMTKYQPKMEELLIDKVISPAAVLDNDGSTRGVDTFGDGKRQMVLWLEPGKEPTQHVLNELLDSREICAKLHEQIVILVQDEESAEEAVFNKVMKQIPELEWHIPAEWGQAERIAQELNLPAYQYPLIYVRDEKKHVIYADCGYNVGSVDLMLKLMTL